MKIQISTEVPLHQTPVHIWLYELDLPNDLWNQIFENPSQLRPLNGGAPVPVQTNTLGNGIDALISMPVGTAQFELESAPEPKSQVTLRENDDQLEILLPDGPFGTYHYEKTAPRPYIWPLYGPNGVELTRAFPMENRAGEKYDHPHHRSLWTAFDEVNGVNNWHDGEGHGWTRHKGFYTKEGGAVSGGFGELLQWTSNDGKPLLDELRIIDVYNVGNDMRLFDYVISWSAYYGDVTFGDTKEAGVIAFRVATSMDGERGGVITNSEGGRGEKECWGKRADWCDYTGEINGETYGITIFSRPDNSGGAPRWHVRDYGLFATNPFSVAAFEGGEKQPFVLKNNESVLFSYRVLLHKGDADAANVAAIRDALKYPPLVTIV